MCSSTTQLPRLRCSIAKTVLAGTLTSTAQGCDRDPKRPVPTMWPACEDRQRRVKARLLRQSRAHCDAEGRERRAATQVRVASDRGHEDVGRGTWDVGRGMGDGGRDSRGSRQPRQCHALSRNAPCVDVVTWDAAGLRGCLGSVWRAGCRSWQVDLGACRWKKEGPHSCTFPVSS